MVLTVLVKDYKEAITDLQDFFVIVIDDKNLAELIDKDTEGKSVIVNLTKKPPADIGYRITKTEGKLFGVDVYDSPLKVLQYVKTVNKIFKEEE